jgi:cytochrome c oxidase subunit IV
MADTHVSPNYWMIWLYLFVLTVVELGVIHLPLVKVAIVALLVFLACYKALLVAMYFMHLKFERRTLGIIALTPFILCLFLILMLIPDIA